MESYNECLKSLSILVGCTALLVATEIYIKRTVDTGVWSYFAVAMVFSLVANLLYLIIIKQNGLAAGFLIATVAMTVGVVMAGCFIFGDPWSHRKSVALLLLIISTVLLALPEPDTSITLIPTKGGAE